MLRLLYDLQAFLAEISGLPAVSLQPAAGAHGELTALDGGGRLLPRPRREAFEKCWRPTVPTARIRRARAWRGLRR